MTNGWKEARLDRDATPGAVTAGLAPQSRAMEATARVVGAARDALVARQAEDGHWIFPLEADATIPAEYILLEHFLDEIDDDIERRLANYLRRTQGPDGGWPLFHAGDMDPSATVKAYFALKMVGDDPDSPHMRRAREALKARGGAETANVFTRFTLALFGQVPWRSVPTMPVELMHLPRWFPFHITKVSYWSRTVMVPLVALAALKPCARNPRGASIAELFCQDPFTKHDWLKNPTGSTWGAALIQLDCVLRRVEPLLPLPARRRAIDKALAFCRERLNGEDGLGGIFPAMANLAMLLDTLGVSRNDATFSIVRRSIRKLILVNNGEAMCQPCLSPIWDTALGLLALIEAGETGPVVDEAARWLVGRQVTDVKGDWAVERPDVAPGGWPFQYRNDYYPDADDSAAVLMALNRSGVPEAEAAIRTGIEWILGMQSENGGWGAFDADNTHYGLNNIPFADHGALLDPPTSDVTARCVGMLIECGFECDHPAVARGLEFLYREQERDGSWYGRWGTNYIYGTWSVLSALNAAGEPHDSPRMRAAVAWLKDRQREDGGWGEDCGTYWEERRYEAKESTPSQTAWALLGLMAAGEVNSEAVARGIEYLKAARDADGSWSEEMYNAVGFPRVFYLKYHGYAAYFPLWALARYQNLRESGRTRVTLGI